MQPLTAMNHAEKRSTLIAVLVAGTFYMEFLDATVIATALPQMAQTFHTSPITLSAGMSVYMLALAVFIPICGWMADRFGSCTVFSTAIGVFTLASILCGISNTPFQFIAARALQGIGGSMMVPVGRLVVLHNTEKKDMIRAIAYLTWPGLLAPVIGPPVGGFITTYATWRWIFFLNVPLGIAGIIFALILIPNRQSDKKPRLDIPGFIFDGVTCVAVMYGMDLIGRRNAPWLLIALMAGITLLFGYLAVWHANHHPHPLLEFSALKIQTFAMSIWGGSLFRMAVQSIPFLTPLMFQIGFGMNAFDSGLMVLAIFLGNVAMKPLTTPALRRYGFRKLLIWNGILLAAAVLACAFLNPGTPRIIILVVLFWGGLCRSMQFTSINTIAFADVPAPQMSQANTLFSIAWQMSNGMGIAVGAVALQMSSLIHGGHSTLTVSDFHLAFIMITVVSIASLYDVFPLDPRAGAVVTGHAVESSEKQIDAIEEGE
jgi:EmrB/QacA subfamily drug resistance transporter